MRVENKVIEAPKIRIVIYHPRMWLCCQQQLSCLQSSKGSSPMLAHNGNLTLQGRMFEIPPDNRKSPGNLQNFRRKTAKALGCLRVLPRTLQEHLVNRYCKTWRKDLSAMIFSIFRLSINPWCRFPSRTTARNLRGKSMEGNPNSPVFRWDLCPLSQRNPTWICPYWPTKERISLSVQSLEYRTFLREKSNRVLVPKDHRIKRRSLKPTT